MSSVLSCGAVARFLITGGTAALLNLCLLWVLTDRFGLWYLGAAVLSYSLSIGYNFALQRMWAFDGTRGPIVRQLPQFALTNVISLGINTALVFMLVETLGVPPLFSLGAASLTVSIFSFVAYRKIFSCDVGRLQRFPDEAR